MKGIFKKVGIVTIVLALPLIVLLTCAYRQIIAEANREIEMLREQNSQLLKEGDVCLVTQFVGYDRLDHSVKLRYWIPSGWVPIDNMCVQPLRIPTEKAGRTDGLYTAPVER